jgi:hypothetical protein
MLSISTPISTPYTTFMQKMKTEKPCRRVVGLNPTLFNILYLSFNVHYFLKSNVYLVKIINLEWLSRKEMKLLILPFFLLTYIDLLQSILFRFFFKENTKSCYRNGYKLKRKKCQKWDSNSKLKIH